MNRRALAGALLAVWLLGACSTKQQVGSDCPVAPCAPILVDAGMHSLSPLPGPRGASGTIDQLDVLFVIDDSEASMAPLQVALAGKLQRFFQLLVNGERDGSGAPEFHAARDVQVGVISTSLGVDVGDKLPDCSLPGLDGLLQDGDCKPSSGNERFFALAPDGDVTALSMDMACRLPLGGEGCRFSQPLEAIARALSPPPAGHGQGENVGFVRPGSLLVIILLTERDDCSILGTDDTSAVPLIASKQQQFGANVDTLCVANADDLQSLGRYESVFASLHPSLAQSVMFFAIAGVPLELTSPEVVKRTMFEDDVSRAAFYQSILDAPSMRQTIDTKGTADLTDDEITPLCNTERGLARPSRRIVEVARSFGVNGLVQSICAPDLSQPLDAILRSIAHRLGPVGI
jgi:hypothetical protein